MKRAVQWFLAGCLSCSLLLAGCSMDRGGSSSPETTDGTKQEPQATTPANQKKTEVAFSTNLWVGSQEESQVWEEIVNTYNNQSDRFKVNLDIQEATADNQRRTWITTQLVGGTAPDIFFSKHNWAQEDFKKGQVVDLTPYYDKENPYNEHKKWLDTFSPMILEQLRDQSNGVLAGVSTYTVAVRVFYNKSMFQQAGITELPQTWGAFMDASAKLKAAGMTPIAFANSKPDDKKYNWSVRMLMDELASSLVPQFDLNSNSKIELNEIAAGVDKGIIDLQKSPWTDVYQIMKDWSQYWSKGYNGISETAAREMFLRGDAAMYLGGTFELAFIADTSLRNFEYGAFPMPPLSKEDHPMSNEQTYEIGSAPQGVYTIPVTTTGDTLQGAVDFLMYLSSPDVSAILADKLYYTPVLANSKLPEALHGFEITGQDFVLNLFGAAIDKKLNEENVQFGQLFLEGSMSLEKYTGELNKDLQDLAKRLMEQNGWNADNNYGSK